MNYLRLIESNSLEFRIHALIEDVFKFTVDKDHFTGTKVQPLVYLKKAARVCVKPWMDVDVFEYALAQRLLLEDCIPHVINIGENFDSKITLNECITYLFECYKVLILYQSNANDEDQDWAGAIDHLIKVIIRKAASALKRPNLYKSQDIYSQVVNVFSENNITHLGELVQFFQLVAAKIRGRNDSFDSVCQLMEPILCILLERIESGSIHNLPIALLDTLEAFVKIPEFALAVVKDSVVPYDQPTFHRYPTSILGTLFSMPSKLLDHSMVPEEYPDENSIYGDIEFMGQQIWPNLKVLSVCLHRILLSFLEASLHNIREVLLKWIRGCLKRNDRHIVHCYRDFTWKGFELNLCSVLLRICLPFIKSTNFLKLLTNIDPTNAFLEDMADYWKTGEILDVLPRREDSFNIECFFMTHRALEVGLTTCLDDLTDSLLEMNKKRRIYKKYPEVFVDWDEVPTRMYNSLRTVLFEPSFIKNLTKFHRATCVWLVQLFFDSKQSHKQNSFAPLQYRNLNIVFPPPTDNLKCVAESLFKNLHSYLMLLSRHHPIALKRIDFDFLKIIFTALIIYMGSNRLLCDTRRKLAECIMCLLPTPTRIDSLKMVLELAPKHFSNLKNKLLNTHPYRRQIIPSLMEIFCGPKMNDPGSTEIYSFKQIFDYYHRTYEVMNHFWRLGNQKQVFKQLAMEAEQNMEAVNPPLFLRFIDILMKEASYYLEEVLFFMAKMEKMQPARVNEEMESTPKDQIELLQKLDKEEQFAISFNILCMDTITMLEYLTEDIKTIFCHNSMVNRIADVLNNYLIHLVGPKKKNFAIKNIDQYKFEPATIVRRICAVYVNLGCDGRFRMAVDRHECAFCNTSQLLYQAADVLTQSKSLESGSDLGKFIWRIEELAKQIEDMPGMLSKAPVDFIDAITSTLMIDPVILPSSRQVVDHWTIERWLSKNEIDPFTRVPLTIDMVQPDVKLKQKIEEWVKKYSASSSLSTILNHVPAFTSLAPK